MNLLIASRQDYFLVSKNVYFQVKKRDIVPSVMSDQQHEEEDTGNLIINCYWMMSSFLKVRLLLLIIFQIIRYLKLTPYGVGRIKLLLAWPHY